MSKNNVMYRKEKLRILEKYERLIRAGKLPFDPPPNSLLAHCSAGEAQRVVLALLDRLRHLLTDDDSTQQRTHR